ncbi:Phosphatidylinositol transfer protein alpha [Lamellibrachia satsuma]|nr:Phosphatidylinositol transfer protein alpha [Lamellibrachia satsuma]
MHLGDNGTTENAHKLSSDLLKKREVVMIDIANDSIEPQDYKPDQDPTKYKSQKTERGPLVGSWMGKVSPVMCCYKLVSIEFKWFGLQNRVEKFIQKSERRLFTNFHRGMFCWTDQWYGLTMADIRTLEEKTKKDLDEQIRTGEVRGLKETN